MAPPMRIKNLPRPARTKFHSILQDELYNGNKFAPDTQRPTGRLPSEYSTYGPPIAHRPGAVFIGGR